MGCDDTVVVERPGYRILELESPRVVWANIVLVFNIVLSDTSDPIRWIEFRETTVRAGNLHFEIFTVDSFT